MKNRYGNEYHFERVDENMYIIKGDLKYWRLGGKAGQQGVDNNDIGFVDPSGGPYISAGYLIDDKPVTNISLKDGEFYFTVSD